MRAFWYVSDSKLEAFLSPSLSDRLKANVKLAVGPLSAEVESSGNRRAKSDVVGRFENAIRGTEIKSAYELEVDAAPAFFRFSGRSVRAIQEDVFYFACLDGTTAVLLVGSPRNAVGVAGSPLALDGYYFSPSSQPMLHAVGLGASAPGGTEGAPSMLTYAWISLMASARHGVPDERLPQAAGVAVYSGLVDADLRRLEQSPWKRVDRLVLGSPVFVEQLGN